MASTGRALLRYLITGGTAAVVDIEGFTLLLSARVPLVLAATCSFVAATVINFLLSSRWVFRSTPTRRRYLSFLIGAVVGLLVNVAATYIGIEHLGLLPTPAKVLAIAMTFLMNFWINARFVFRTKPA